jgi:hypothetical protein
MVSILHVEATDPMRMADLKRGWVVIGNDGRRVGTVRDVGQNYVLTSISGLSGDIYVPASAIANVEHESVHLSVAQHDVAAMGWEQAPRDDDAPEQSSASDLHRHI